MSLIPLGNHLQSVHRPVGYARGKLKYSWNKKLKLIGRIFLWEGLKNNIMDSVRESAVLELIHLLHLKTYKGLQIFLIPRGEGEGERKLYRGKARAEGVFNPFGVD